MDQQTAQACDSSSQHLRIPNTTINICDGYSFVLHFMIEGVIV